jgi:hypothetical protein
MAGTIVANTINTDTGLFSTNNAYSGIAKAWVSFVGSTGAINKSFNVSSITRNSAGNYTVNFTTAMTDATFAPIITTGTGSSSQYGNTNNTYSLSTSALSFVTTIQSGGVLTVTDIASVYVTIFD